MTQPQLLREMTCLVSQLSGLNKELVETVEERDAKIASLESELEAERNKLKENDMLSPEQAAKLIGMSVSYLGSGS